jgi:radical SAM family uncharacterized protein
VTVTDATNTPIPWTEIEAVLHTVLRPGRYVGGEYNAVHKPWTETDLHVCLAFPDTYELGMSNYALTLLYDVLNQQPGVLAHRTYLPAPDMIAAMREAALPLYALETYRPVAAFDVLGISTAYEQLYTNTLEMMDLAGLPIHSADRGTGHPLVVGGGHGTFNPEPIADFFDVFVIGEAEEVLIELTSVMRANSDLSRHDQLRALAQVPGLYVPRFYRPRYDTGGNLVATAPTEPGIPKRIVKRIAPSLPPSPLKPLVPNTEVVHNRAVVEIHRGCTRGCRFCQAGTITRPVRERSVEEIVDAAEAILDNTGYEELALLSLSSADYSEFDRLLDALLARFEGRNVSISLPSLRIDAFSVDLADKLSHGRRSGFTFAPEAGTERLRSRINKDVTDEALLSLAHEVFSRGWRSIKLYFMIGLPGETDADVEAIVDLTRQVRAIGQRVGGRRTSVRVSAGTFVPKPQTVFQWEPLTDRETVERRQAILQDGLHGRGLTLSWNRYADTWLEALLTRGDRRLSAVVEQAWRYGARFDAWDEWRDMDAWNRSLAETASRHFKGPKALTDHFLYRRCDETTVFPWDHIHSGVEKRFLLEDLQRSQEEARLPDCREGCHGCGILQAYPELRKDDWACPVLHRPQEVGR